MTSSIVLIIILALTAVAFQVGLKRAHRLADNNLVPKLHSQPVYYGTLTALWCGVPALLLYIFWIFFEPSIVTGLVIADLPPEFTTLPPGQLKLVINDITSLAGGNIIPSELTPSIKQAADHYIHLQTISKRVLAVLIMVACNLAIFLSWRKISPLLRARNHVEKMVKISLIICSSFAIFTTLGILLSVLFESIKFFQEISVFDFLFGLKWSPQMAIRSDQVGSSGAFGAIPVFTGTLMISMIAMMVAVPLGLMSAIYLSEYADKKFRTIAKPMLEILAGIPTVVYGFFAALTVAPLIRENVSALGFGVSSESALAAGLVMGIMIIPFISSLADDAINAVPQSLRDGAYALGTTPNETIKQVVIPAALPGIVGGVLLAVSRAIGETMIVVMAAGLAANLTANPLQAVTTVTVQIVTLLVGDQEFDSPKTLAAFALGLIIFIVTLTLNIIALHIVRKYREQYE